jgi:hypothetical protein
MAAADSIAKLQGTWEYVEGERFDDYMKEIVSESRRYSSS